MLRSSGYAQHQSEAEEEGNKRYFVPEGKVKQPIFGSKKYNPVIQQFECNNETSSKTHASKLQLLLSTMETINEHWEYTTPEVELTAAETEVPGPVIISTEGSDIETDTSTAPIDSLRGQLKTTKIWWQNAQTKQQNKGGKKKSRKYDIQE